MSRDPSEIIHYSYHFHLILTMLKTDVLLNIIVENVATIHFHFMEKSSLNILLNVLFGREKSDGILGEISF